MPDNSRCKDAYSYRNYGNGHWALIVETNADRVALAEDALWNWGQPARPSDAREALRWLRGVVSPRARALRAQVRARGYVHAE